MGQIKISMTLFKVCNWPNAVFSKILLKTRTENCHSTWINPWPKVLENNRWAWRHAFPAYLMLLLHFFVLTALSPPEPPLSTAPPRVAARPAGSLAREPAPPDLELPVSTRLLSEALLLEPLLPAVPPRVAARPAGSLALEPAPLFFPVLLLPLLIPLLLLPTAPPPPVPLLCAMAELAKIIAASNTTIEVFRMTTASWVINGKNTDARCQGLNITTTDVIFK